MKRQAADRFRKRMKRQTDINVQEEDENASWQTGSGRGWKGKLTIESTFLFVVYTFFTSRTRV
jgi:hypothetical protein